jgi:hypothetical protein
LIFAWISGLAAAQETAATAAAPVPVQMGTAKKVFISNAGGQQTAPRWFSLRVSSPDDAYSKFFAAIVRTREMPGSSRSG